MTRWTYRFLFMTLMLFVIAGSVGCIGGNSEKQRRPEPTSATSTSGGAVLRPLTSGHDVLAPDGWYTLRIPLDWITAQGVVAETSARATTGNPPLSINVAREKLDEITQPQAYVEATRQTVNRTYQDVVTVSLAPVRIGDTDAYRWIYTATLSGKKRLIYQIFIVKGGIGLVLTGSASGDADVGAARETFDSIAGSLSFGRG